ncbi:DUF7674 family protein [Bradyrhizobium yuanmingense]|uniref:DUF7674 family protein n=1 Tax=Bradyrhizobium yuanmingense TaxID=108015 RepID=UPI0023B88FCD|nr:hypothetical protein [Bradyrhizobium yuanmingense]MDF0583341.1 hypothetical protein [Bradyrhizobium yuanmingense]
MGDLHRSVFLKELKDSFPDLRPEIDAQHGLLNLEMHVFTDLVQRGIAARNAKEVASCFKLAEKYFRDGNDHLQNAIGFSFLEHLNLQNAQWAWELLGPILQREYLQLVDAGMAKPLPYRR